MPENVFRNQVLVFSRKFVVRRCGIFKKQCKYYPIQGGRVGAGLFYIISLWFRCGWCSAILNHNGLLCNIAWGWFWAFERWEVAYCSCGVYGASYNVLLERWQKPKTTGALAERWQSVGRVGAKRSAIAFLFLFWGYLKTCIHRLK